jgi:hypothetical protein
MPMFKMDNRLEYLGRSLLVEALLSSFLSGLIGISDHKNSKSFGNKSSALSFKAKVNLLLDMKVFDKSDDWKLEKFMEIRNQFVHNLDAVSYEVCTNLIQGAQSKLLKEYPQEQTLSIEEQLRNSSLELANNVQKIIKKVFNKALSNALQKDLKKAMPSSLLLQRKHLKYFKRKPCQAMIQTKFQ